jgi:metal-responsive CopG/Arc/MetJ family transcriptional regulator
MSAPVELSKWLLADVDEFAARNGIDRETAVRRLVQRGLDEDFINRRHAAKMAVALYGQSNGAEVTR